MIKHKIFTNIAFIILMLSCSCVQKEAQEQSIRIVDKNGNPVPLQRRTPQFNEQQLSKQRTLDGAGYDTVNSNAQYNENNLPVDIFADRKSVNNKIISNNNSTQIQDEKVIFTLNEKERNRSSINKGRRNYKTKTAKKQTKKKYTVQNKAKKRTAYKSPRYIQVGAFKSKANANRSLASFSNISNGKVRKYQNAQNKIIYRVLLGPFRDQKQAEFYLGKVLEKGHYDVFITKR